MADGCGHFILLLGGTCEDCGAAVPLSEQDLAWERARHVYRRHIPIALTAGAYFFLSVICGSALVGLFDVTK
jgi:hypothetical protein